MKKELKKEMFFNKISLWGVGVVGILVGIVLILISYHINFKDDVNSVIQMIGQTVISISVSSLLLEWFGYVNYTQKRMCEILAEDEVINILDMKRKRELKSALIKNIYMPNANFEENNIPVIVLEMRTYAQVKNTVSVLGKITGNEAKAEELNKDMDERIAAVRAKMPQESKRIAILHSTAQNVTVQLEGSIAGSTAQLLGFTNIAAGSMPLENTSTAAPYSLETLVAANPDIIYITSMGKLETVQDAMLKSIGASPAWQSLAAVRSGHVYFLPQELFLLSPGIKYPQAAEYMAKLAYPENFE